MGLFGGLVAGDSLVQKEQMDRENQDFRNALSQQQLERNNIQLENMRKLAAQDQAMMRGVQTRRRDAIGNALRSLWDMSRGNGSASLTPSQLKQVVASDPDYFRGLTGVAFGDNDTGRGKKGKVARLQFGNNAIDLNEDQMGKVTGMSYRDYLEGLKVEDELKTSELKRQQMVGKNNSIDDIKIGDVRGLIESGVLTENDFPWIREKFSLGKQEQTPEDIKKAREEQRAVLLSRGIDPDMGIAIDKDGMTGSAYTNIGNGESLGFMLKGKMVNLKKGDTFESNGKKWRWNGGGSGRDTFADVTNEVVAKPSKITEKGSVKSKQKFEPKEIKKTTFVNEDNGVVSKPYSDENMEKRFQEFKENRKKEIDDRNAMRSQYGANSYDSLESDDVLRQLFIEKEQQDAEREEDERITKEQSEKKKKEYSDLMKNHFTRGVGYKDPRIIPVR